MNGGSVEIGRGGDAAPIDESEVKRECLDGSGHAIAARAAQLDKVIRCGNGDEEPSLVAQDTPEFARIHPCRDRQNERERAIGIRHEAVGIGHDPLASRVAPRRGINGWNRDVDAMRIEADLASEDAEVETVTAAGIENAVARRRYHDLRDRLQHWLCHAAIVQSPPPGGGNRRVARLL